MDRPKQRSERLPEKLKSIRVSLGLSQNELIRKLGFEGDLIQSHISAYEVKRHNRVPPIGVLLQYSRVSGIPLENIIDDALELKKI